MDATERPPADSSMTLRDHIDQLIKAAAKPLALSDLKKLLQQRNVPVKGPKGFKDLDIERTANDAVADGTAFAHPPVKGKAVFWHTVYVTPPTPAKLVAKTVREKVAALGDDAVVADAKLGKPTGKKLTDETAKAFDDTLAELIATGELHRHGEKYGKKVAPPPKPPKPTPTQATVETVRKKVAELADHQVVTDKQLGKPAGKKETAETTAAFETVLKELIANGSLHEHPGGKFGKTKALPPAKWFEKAPHKAKIASLAKAANALLSAAGVTLEEMFAALRGQIGTTPTVVETPPPVPPVVVPPPPPADLRTVLKQAYDDLCEFVEFRDKLVELPRLYREAVKTMPGLTPEAFQAELWEMGRERVIELSVINDERAATHPELAIRRHDSLYYYARWN